MLATNNATTSIRINQEFKEKIGKLAKSKKINFTKLLSIILKEYLEKEEQKNKVAVFKKLQKEIQETEIWTADQEILVINKNRKDNSYRIK